MNNNWIPAQGWCWDEQLMLGEQSFQVQILHHMNYLKHRQVETKKKKVADKYGR